MKKILIIFVSIFLLFSCWSSSTSKTDSSSKQTQKTNEKKGLRLYSGKDFSMQIPAAWNDLSNNKEVLPNPSVGNVELAITSANTKNWFANNLIILSQELEDKISSKDYAITNNIWAENEYLNYYSIKKDEFEFLDWEKSMIYVFKAKYAENTPILKFIQTARVCDNKAFLLTIALPLEIKDTTKYEKMLSTFECK